MEKPCLILDLDETVISTLSRGEIKKLPEKERAWLENNQDTIRKYDWFEDKIPPNKWGKSPDDDDYITFERPGLQSFLDFAFSNFNIFIWTAGSPEYAARLVENIILRRNKDERRIQSILSSYHTSVSDEKFGNLKDLRLFWKTFQIIPEFKGCNKHNTIIMDDNPEVYIPNKANCIFMKPFDMSKPTKASKDRFLVTIQKQLTVLMSSGDRAAALVDTTRDDTEDINTKLNTVKGLLIDESPLDVSAINYLNGME